MQKTLRNLQAGDTLTVYAPEPVPVIFLGFSDIDYKYGEGGPRFKNLNEVKQHFNVRNLAQLEHVGDDLPYGHSVYAMFQTIKTDGRPDYDWAAYLFNGKWCYGTSADTLRYS